MHVAGKNILVVGLGMTGVAVARFLQNRGASVIVTDMADGQKLAPAVRQLGEAGIRMELGQHRMETFQNADLIVISPGVSHTIEPVKRAKEKGVTVLGEVELASRFIREPMVAVTGTNGKTTTTTLLANMLTHSGVKVFVGGNIGNPLVGYVDRGEKAQVIVAEISSFQLDTINAFRPDVAVLLNITEDHLDRYPDFAAYVKSKGRIFENQQKQDTAVLNGSDPHIRSMLHGIQGRKLFFKGRSETEEGATITHEKMILHAKGPLASSGNTVRRGDLKIREQGSLDFSEIKLPGRHNRENAAAACLAALAAGGTLEGAQSALNDFQGLPHRLEYAATIRDVRYFNDSKSTTVDSVIRALECFSEPVILIMGGKDKGGSYRGLKDPVRRCAKKLLLMGEATENIKSVLGNIAPTATVQTMEEAVFQAHQAASAGDVVLLSPGCSSFDMFDNYAHRGKVFCEAVENLKGKIS